MTTGGGICFLQSVHGFQWVKSHAHGTLSHIRYARLKKSACASNIPPFKGTETFQNLGGLEIFQLETPYLHAVEMAMNNFCAVS